MDIDPEEDNGLNHGAIEDDNDNEYGLNPTQQKCCKQCKKTTTNEEDEAHDNGTPSNLHQNDPGNFLKLCMALKILVRWTITEEDLQKADSLIREYCWELVEVSSHLISIPSWALHPIYLALWACCHLAKPPLCNTHMVECAKLWTAS
jgi:hypothetical protein